MTETPTKNRSHPRTAALLLVFAVAALLRFWGAGTTGLWQDEVLCVHNAERSFAQTVEILRKENQPPLYHFTLHAWMGLFGRGPFAVRSLSVVAGLILLALMFQVGRELFDDRTARWGLLIATLSAALLEFTQEVTPYALYLALCMGASLAFIRLWRREGSWALWIAYVLLRAASIYVHYFGLFNLCAEGFWVLLHLRSRRGFLLRWAGSQVAVILSFAPWLPIFLEQRARVHEGGFWVPALRLLDPPNALRQWALWVPELGHKPWNAIIPVAALVHVFLLALVFVLTVRGWVRPREAGPGQSALRDGRSGATLAFCYFLVPMVVVLILSLRDSIFTPKYLLACAPFYYLLVANGLAQLRTVRPLEYGLGAVLLSLSVVACVLSLAHPGYRNPECHEAAAAVRTEWREGDLLVHHDSQTFSTLQYYLHDLEPAAVWWLFPKERVPFWQGLEGFDKGMFVNDLEPFLAGNPRIWLVAPIANGKPWEPNYGDSMWEEVIRPRFQAMGYREALRETFNGVEVIRLDPTNP